MPIESAPPSVQDSEKRPLHLPIVLLKNPQTFRRRREENLTSLPVIALEEVVELRRHCEDDVEVRAVRQPFANRLRPSALPRSQAERAMAVATRTRIPFTAMALLTLGLIEAQFAMSAMREEIESAILLLAQSPRPTRPEIPQKTIDTEISHKCSYKHSLKTSKPRSNLSLLLTFYFARNFSPTVFISSTVEVDISLSALG